MQGVSETEHPALGRLRAPAHPARFSGERLPTPQSLGVLGEHTEEVLAELSYDGETIAQYAREKIIGVVCN